MQHDIDAGTHHVQFVGVANITDLTQTGDVAVRIDCGDGRAVPVQGRRSPIRWYRRREFSRRMIQQLPDDFTAHRAAASGDEDRFI